MVLEALKEQTYRKYLAWQCRSRRIARHLDALIDPVHPPRPVERRRVRAAALQLQLKLCRDPLTFVEEMHRHTRRAAGEGAHLVAFPEYNNLFLLGLLPGIERLEEEQGGEPEGGPGPVSSGHSRDEDISLPQIFRYMSPVVAPLVHTLFSKLARAYHLYIMAGSYILAEGEDIVNRAFLYGPGGELLGSQDKVNLMPLEATWPLKRGRTFSIYQTQAGNLALPVCMDATYYETFRYLELAGAEIALLPIADMQEYNFWLALRGIQLRVQESPLYGVKSALVGKAAGFIFSGRAGVFAPLELTPGRNGILSEVDTFNREAMALADLDLEALAALRRDHPWRDSNPALYRALLNRQV